MSGEETVPGHRVFERFAADDGEARVELLVQPALNYALLHNRVPAVRNLAVHNHGAAPLTGLDLTLELLGPQGPLAEPWRHTAAVPVTPGASVHWEDLAGFRPDPAVLRAADEAFPVDYRLTVRRAGRAELRVEAPSTALAHDEWFHAPALYDSLAAFVQPNTKAVDVVLRDAAQLLLARTGSGSLAGYAAGPQRAAQVAGAVYETLRGLGIHYRTMPPSFEHTGQRVRSTAAVLDGRLANCLDLSVTYAACLEAAGLRPLIWLTPDHAFAGFLLEEERLGTAVVTEANLLVAMVESGAAVPVELTRIGPGPGGADFAEAVRAGVVHFRVRSGHSQVGNVQAVIDVALAHRSGIRPLPSTDDLLTTPDVPAPVVAVGSIDLPDGAAAARLRRLADEADAPAQHDDAPPRVQHWKKSLLDLSLRNPLLNLPRRGRGLDLHIPPGVLRLLDDHLHSGRSVEIVPQDAISKVHQLAGVERAQDLDPGVITDALAKDRRIFGAVTDQRYRNAMRAIQRDARTMEQETGSNYLYLTIGTLVHPKTSGGEAHAPLFLLPVRLEGGVGQRRYSMVLDGAETATPNHCLIEWLRVKHGVRIPELEQPLRDEAGIDVAATLAAVSSHLVGYRLNYRIDETASLRLLQFATFQMWRDLTDHWRTFLGGNPVVRHLVESAGASFTDPAVGDDGGDPGPPVVDEATLHLPIPADGSQMQAIVMAERGQSFVLEGPPGTGKSQTITNLIARAVAAGRTVLFVAEKQAALEVVKRRLQQIGLGPFALDLHGRKQSMNAIRAQLREALDQHERGDDVTWTAVETGYRARLAPLAAYPAQVHTPNRAGLSAWSAYEATLAYGDGPAAPIPAAYLSTPDEPREAAEQALRDLPAAARSARLRPAHPWSVSGCRSVDSLPLPTVVDAAAQLERVRGEAAPLADLLREVPDPRGLADLLAAAWLAARGELPDRATTLRAADPRWDAAVNHLQGELHRFRQTYAAELAAFRPEVFTVPELAAWHTEAQRVAGRWFGKRKRRRVIADRLAPYGATVDARAVEAVLGRLVGAQQQAAALLRLVQSTGGLLLPPRWLPTAGNAEPDLAAARRAAETSRALLRDGPGAWEILRDRVTDAEAALLDRLASAWRTWLGALQAGTAELALWTGPAHWLDAWHRDGPGWGSELAAHGLRPLQRWAALLRLTDTLAAAGLTGFRAAVLRAELDPDRAEQAYRRGVAATALTERVHAGDVEYFDPEAHDSRIAQFVASAEELRRTLPDRLATVLVRRRPFSPGQRRGPFADFAAELRRKRGGKSFRELFQAYPDVVSALTPCVLVSPASAANFLAPDAARFDLVIFDEASQIRVAEAIGAMGRGRAAVIVGDSRQMPPTTIMQASHGTDEETDAEGPVPEDLDSILSEAVESGLPQQWLSWHYRSHDESLIAFSNRFYYDNKLASLPSPGAAGLGVRWRRVDGRFDRGGSRTNEVEARGIVDEIARRLADPASADESLGVVTFNIQQRDLILDLLEDSADPLVRARLSAENGEPIFVKNLENVQGDERDVVLFSLAFSVDPDTGRLPLNFGPLSQTGGERRLNVAVTRARRQVMLFASFDPEDIDLTRTTSVGTAHLRAYCELAAAGLDRLGDLASPAAARRDLIREEVAAAIRARGHEVRTGHGMSDFTVDIAVRASGASRWQVAVMLDGPQWSARPTVADRDVAPTLLHSIMGWPEVVRCWLPGWLTEPDALLDRVDAAVGRAADA